MNRIDDWNEHYTTCTECGARYHASEGSHCDDGSSDGDEVVALQYRLSGEDYSVRIFDTELEAEDYAFDWLEEQYENARGEYTYTRSLDCVEEICHKEDIAYIEITPVRLPAGFSVEWTGANTTLIWRNQ